MRFPDLRKYGSRYEKSSLKSGVKWLPEAREYPSTTHSRSRRGLKPLHYTLHKLCILETSTKTTNDIESSSYTMTEQNLDIICACLPVCRPPLEYLFPRRFQTPTCAPKKKSMDTSDSTLKDAQRQC